MKFYNTRQKTILILMLSFVLFAGMAVSAFSQAGSKEEIPNIILITLSGVRNSESIDDPTHQYIPHLWNEMLKEGVLFTNLVDLNKEFHVPAVNAIITGENYLFFPEEGLDRPSIFQYVIKKYNLEKNKVWLIGTWKYDDRVCKNCPGFGEDTFPCQLTGLPLGASREAKPLITEQGISVAKTFYEIIVDKPLLGISAAALYMHWDSLENMFYGYLKDVMQNFKPKFIYYMMGAVDCAHYGTFANYALALKNSDERIFEIWQMIKKDAFYRRNTYLIVCVDHGRNLYYMDHTENVRDNPSHVWMYIYGPNIKKGTKVKRLIHHVDIFATLAYIMNVETLPTSGSVLNDCFLQKMRKPR